MNIDGEGIFVKGFHRSPCYHENFYYMVYLSDKLYTISYIDVTGRWSKNKEEFLPERA